MPSRTRRRVSASLLVLAAAKVASAQSTTYVNGTPSTTPAPANPYATSQEFPTTVANLAGGATNLTLNSVLANGGFAVTDTGSSTLVYEYSPNSSTPVVVGPTTGDFVNLAGTSNQSYRAANFAGSVLGQSTRYIPGSNTSAGSDAFLYIPSVQASTGSDIIIGTQGVLGAVNTTGAANGTIYYNYAVTATVNGNTLTGTFRTLAPVSAPNGATSAPTAINANNQVILTANRYTGVAGQTVSLGMDAFLFTPATNGSATGTTTLLGLTGSPYYYYNNTIVGYVGASSPNINTYQTSNSTPFALNATGAVIGTTLRYASNTPSIPNTLNNFVLGTDAWLYSGATALNASSGSAPIGTVQVGLVGSTTQAAQGGYYTSTVTFSNGSTGLYETSGVNGISTAGAVTGTSAVFAANTSSSTTPSSLGSTADAWQFKPTLTGGSGLTTATASGFGTTAVGTYVQLGLTTAPSGTNVGYLSTAASNAGTRTQTLSATNAAGNVAGTTQRYFAGSASASGADAWYYNGSNSSYLITPTANPSYSTYINSANSSSSTLNATMSAGGVVAGTQNRYMAGTTTLVGSDAFAYSPATNNTYVIASPALIANDVDFAAYNTSGSGANNATTYFSSTIKSVSDAGLVIGTFNAYNGSTTSAASVGTYVYAWTQQAGTVVVGSTSNTTSTIAALTLNTSSGTTSINVGSIYADGAGDIYGLGTASGSSLPEIFEFAAAPEPTSLALLGLGLTPLLGRRRRPCVTAGR